jgi:hypothetical protein
VSEVRSLADEYWAYFRSTAQLCNIDRGDLDQIEHWEDLSPDGLSARGRRLAALAEVAERLSRDDTTLRYQASSEIVRAETALARADGVDPLLA